MTIDTTAYGAMAVANIATFGVAVTYQRTVLGAFNTSTGKSARTTTDTSITAQRGASRREFVGQGKKRVEKRVYLIRASDLANEPQAPDVIIDGSVTWNVVDWGWRVSELVYEVRCVRTI